MRWSLLWLLCCLLVTVGCKEDETPEGNADDDATDGDDDATDGDDDAEVPPYADGDGDGVPDERDLCADTTEGAMTDPRGCSAAQASGCAVTLTGPEDGASAGSDTVTFSFDGDCDGYRLYASDSESFPPHRRHLLADMIPAGDVDVSVAALPTPTAGDTLYWAVEGSSRGHSFLSEKRTLELE